MVHYQLLQYGEFDDDMGLHYYNVLYNTEVRRKEDEHALNYKGIYSLNARRLSSVVKNN
jgi:hypothetical protein